MATAQDTARTVSTNQARKDFARFVRDAEYGATVLITRHKDVVAKLTSPDAGRMPDPDLWQAAQEAYDKAITTGLTGAHPSVGRALKAFGELLAAHYGYEPRTEQ